MPRIRTCFSPRGKRECFGAKVLPLVREIEESEQGSVGEPVPVSASPRVR